MPREKLRELAAVANSRTPGAALGADREDAEPMPVGLRTEAGFVDEVYRP